MTVRNVRAHQSRGLLPPAAIRGRTGYYGRDHVQRLRLIQELQAEGFNLKAIERVIEAANGSSGALFEFRRVLLSSFAGEDPELTTDTELENRMGGRDDRQRRKAEKLGLIRPLGDGRYEVPSPTLLNVAEELVAMGVPLRHLLAVAEQMNRHAKAIADSFVRLFREDFLDRVPGRDQGEGWQEMTEALERLQPIASDAVRAAFQQTMSHAIERELGRLIDK